MSLTAQQIDNIQLGLGLAGLPTNLATYQTDVYIATAAQTAFALSATPLSGYSIHVIVNGVMLLQALYSLSTATITLTTPSTVGDFVSIGYFINA